MQSSIHGGEQLAGGSRRCPAKTWRAAGWRGNAGGRADCNGHLVKKNGMTSSRALPIGRAGRDTSISRQTGRQLVRLTTRAADPCAQCERELAPFAARSQSACAPPKVGSPVNPDDFVQAMWGRGKVPHQESGMEWEQVWPQPEQGRSYLQQNLDGSVRQ